MSSANKSIYIPTGSYIIRITYSNSVPSEFEIVGEGSTISVYNSTVKQGDEAKKLLDEYKQ